MIRTKPICPICRRPVDKTPGGKIAGHLDKARNACPGSYESYTMAMRTA